MDFLGAFAGQVRFLEIAARPDAGAHCSTPESYTTLSPRQRLTTTPYAAFSLNAGNLNSQPATFYTNATNLSTGTLPDARLSSNVPRLSTPNIFTGVNQFTAFTGVNRSTPITGADVFGLQNPPGSTGYTGMYINSTDNADGRPFYGYVANGLAAWTWYDTTGTWHLYNGDENLVVTRAGNVGIGTAEPTSRLHVIGPAAASDFTYTAPITSFYAVSQSAFVSRDGVPIGSTVSQGGVWPLQPSISGLCAPVNLPHGATVTRVRFHYLDNDAKDLAFYFMNHHPEGAFGILAAGGTTGSSPAFQSLDLPNLNIPIDNSTYTYQITVYPSSAWSGFSMMMRGAHIEYTMPRPAR